MRDEGVKFASKLMCEVTMPQWNETHYYLSKIARTTRVKLIMSAHHSVVISIFYRENDELFLI